MLSRTESESLISPSNKSNYKEKLKRKYSKLLRSHPSSESIDEHIQRKRSKAPTSITRLLIKALNRKKILYILIENILFLLVTFFVIGTIIVIVNNNKKTEFDIITSNVNENIQGVLYNSLKEVKNLKASFATHGESWKESIDFRTFINLIHNSLNSDIGIQALEWIPRIKDDNEANELVQMIRNSSVYSEILEDYLIKKKISNGSMVESSGEDEYYPVYYVHPIEGNEKAIGFDLRSNKVRKKSLELARDNATQIATSKITLVQEMASQSGFLVFDPCYGNYFANSSASDITINDLRERLIGFGLGVFRVGDLIEESIEHMSGIKYYYLTIVDQNSDILFTDYKDYKDKITLTNFKVHSSSLTRVHSLDVADRQWTSFFISKYTFEQKYQTTTLPLLMFFCFIMVTVNVLIVFLYISNQTKRIVVNEYKSIILSHLKDKSDLLERILPKQIISKMLSGCSFIANRRKNACIFFLDICEFTKFADRRKDMTVIKFLNFFFRIIDKCAAEYQVSKIKTIGDGYMAGTGIFSDNKSMKDNTLRVLLFALDLQISLNDIIKSAEKKIRMGISSGPVFAGVLGSDIPSFDVFGDTCNVASRMESTCLPNEIQVPNHVKDICEKEIMFEERKETVFVKGKGEMNLFFVKGIKNTKDTTIKFVTNVV